MAIIGTLLKKGIILRESLEQRYTSAPALQKQELSKLMIHCRHTEFGREFQFDTILKSFKRSPENHYYEVFKKYVPIFDYDKMDRDWWHRTRAGEKNITWPGKIKYYALSSGTSGSSSKHIPVTKDMLRSMRRISVRQILTLSKYDLPDDFFTKGILMLGGSTNLKKHGSYYEGDLSGITTSRIPLWLQSFYKPGKKIAKTVDWGQKLDEIVKKARDWDIGIIVGVPAWLQILMEKIVDSYNVNTIHDIWPNLRIFVHGGVPFEPYRKGFDKLLARPLMYTETYLASEGFLAFQALPEKESMKLVLNNGIFFEFIPFNEDNFTTEGVLKENPETLAINNVEEGREYALLISTNAGAWRYMIGDVIRFVSVEETEIVITGRTKMFLSLCGEHLSMDNMNKAVELVSEEMNLDIREFTVIGEPHGSLFSHTWYVGTDDQVDAELLKQKLDDHLKNLNDDYAVERQHALKELKMNLLPSHLFYDWMRNQGKEGGQNKFPRVLKEEKAHLWREFLHKNHLNDAIS